MKPALAIVAAAGFVLSTSRIFRADPDIGL